MRRPRLLVTCCGEGGGDAGYVRAGWDVTGVDLHPMPRYPFRFVQADALDVLAHWDLSAFNAIAHHPPCQRWCKATLSWRRRGREYPDLITPARPLLEASGLPWIMENVPDAPLRGDVELCGCQFGLELPGTGQLLRPRLIETSWGHREPPVVHDHHAPAISICGHGTPSWQRRVTGHIPVAAWREVMGIPWMTRAGLTEAVPPAYGEYAGRLLMEAPELRAVAA